MFVWGIVALRRFGPFSAPLVSAALFALAGICVDRMTALAAHVWFGLALVAIVVSACLRQPTGRSLCLLLAVAMLSGAWHHYRWHMIRGDHIANDAPVPPWPARPVVLRGEVISELRQTSFRRPGSSTLVDSSYFRLRVHQLLTLSGWEARSGSLLVRCVTGTEAMVGDSVRLSGQLRSRSPPSHGAERSRIEAGWRDGLLCTLDVPAIESMQAEPARTSGPWRWWRRWLAGLRRKWDRRLENKLCRRVYPFASAMLLGNRTGLDPQLRDCFLRTGTVHLLAISGLHVGILASALLFASRGRLLPFRLGLGLTIGLSVFYAQLTELRSPVLRASVLIQLMCLSWLTYRPGSLTNVLAAAGLAVMLRQPGDVFDVGTQLSFLGVATLGYVGKRLQFGPPSDPLARLIWRTSSVWQRAIRLVRMRAAQLLMSSLAVWCVTSPLVWLHFNLVSWVALPLNALLWLPLALGLLSGFATLLLPEAVCGVAAAICDLSLSTILNVVSAADRMPGAYSWVVTPNSWAIATCYLGLALAAVTSSRVARARWGAVIAVGLAVAFLFPKLQRSWDRAELRCTFLDVGHGTCVVIEFSDGRTWLYDAGTAGATRARADSVARFLWARGIDRIDTILISHLDLDHYSLLPGIAERFSIRCVALSQTMGGSRQVRHPLQVALDQHQIVTKRLRRGDELNVGPCRVTVWHPPDYHSGELRSDNEMSLCCTITAPSGAICLPGDLEGDALREVLARQGMPRVDVAMAPHHGSEGSLPDRFRNWCGANHWIVSGRERYGGLRLHQVGRARLWHTAYHGAVEVVFADQRAEVSSYRRYAGELGKGPGGLPKTYRPSSVDENRPKATQEAAERLLQRGVFQ